MIEFNDLVRKIKLARKYIMDKEYQEAYNTLYLPPEIDSNQVQAVVMQKIAGKNCFFVVERDCTQPEVYYSEEQAKDSMQYKLGGKITKACESNFTA